MALSPAHVASFPRFPGSVCSLRSLMLPRTDHRNLCIASPMDVRKDCSASCMSAAAAAAAEAEPVLAAIEELERMAREPADVLADAVDRLGLSPRELQLVLLYFAQEGRDAYCALEVFDWLRRENRVDGETMELMMSIASGWVERMVGGEHDVGEVVALLGEMECVGLQPVFGMVKKVVSLYWERGEKDRAVEFVKDVMRKGRFLASTTAVGGAADASSSGSRADHSSCPVGYLASKMMVDGNYMDAVRLIIEFKENGWTPEVYSYLIGLAALLMEQKNFSKALRKLHVLLRDGSLTIPNAESLLGIKNYQSELLRYGVLMSDWATQEGNRETQRLARERLLMLYACAGRGLQAEHQIWEMKVSGQEPDSRLYDVVLAICASQSEVGAVRRLLTGVKWTDVGSMERTMSWLLRGYVKGELFLDASKTLVEMLDMGVRPGYLDRAVVLHGMRKTMVDSGDLEPYAELCRRLADADLIGPCILCLYFQKRKLWVLKML